MDYSVNATGLACPMPVIETKKLIASLTPEELDHAIITVLVDNTTANTNVAKYARSVGLTATSKEHGGIYFLTLQREGGEAAACIAAEPGDASQEAPVYFFGTDSLGADPELGASLMKTLLFTLSESSVVPSHLIFLNAGVKLTTEDIPALAALEAKGASILSCGACLNYFGLEGQLKVGSVSNMFEIVEVLNRAPRVIRI